ncbi:FtsX-like permease family protein [Spirulina subsalsa]|uniref:FtsX-like permease family protein n=1 Tax=Spirulina subsalsa TaxID=54311 RepID=UPI0002E2C67C|nr:FtsX-like permease family protein [Spirulina subsalsa]
MVSIARKNLFEDLPRFLVAQAGIMFAVSLVTIQTGLLNGFTRSTALLIDASPADIWITSDELVHMELTLPLLLEQVNQANQVPGVARAEPLMTGLGRWQIPGGELTPLRLYGFDPNGVLFRPGQLQSGQLADLNTPYNVMVDQGSLNSLSVRGLGDRGFIGNLPATIVGITSDSQAITSATYIFSSLETAKAFASAGFSSSVDCRMQPDGTIQCTTLYEKQDQPLEGVPTPEPMSSTDPIQYILIQAEPGQDIGELQARLEATFPNTKAWTQEELSQATRNYWQKRTGIGFILGLGATVGVIVGIVIVGQILYSSVADHLKEFGTLKAMGASNRMLYGVIIEQAVYMAVLGYIPGILLCLGLGKWTMASQGIMILITPSTAIVVLGITLVMCVGSALFAIQKVTRVDPIIVFKA